MKSFGFFAAEQSEKHYFKCHKSNEIQMGFYSDAVADCENLDSSIQTYLTEVRLKIEHMLCCIAYAVLARISKH